MILPIVTYGSLLHLNPTMCQRKKLTSLHNRSTKIINSRHNIPSPYAITVIKSCEFVRNCLDENTCRNFQYYFDKAEHGKFTRNCKYMVKLPKIKLEYCRNSFFYMGAKLYNELPLTVRKMEKLDEFKKHLKEFAILNLL